jgi:hypothetical protein
MRLTRPPIDQRPDSPNYARQVCLRKEPLGEYSLFVTVLFNVGLASMLLMLVRMISMTFGRMSVMSSLFMVTALMVLGRFRMMARGVFVMF